MKPNLEAALTELPIFPLPQVVLFPRALLPLHIFEPRYRTMLKDCLETHGALAVVLATETKEGKERGEGLPKIASVAGAGIIVEHHELDDGRLNVLLHGAQRVRLEELPFVPPYRRARATILHEVPSHVAATDRSALLAAAAAFAGHVRKRDPNFSLQLPPSLEPGAIADLYAHHLILDAATRQQILEELDVAQRVRLVIEALAMQHGALANDAGGVLS